MNAEDVTRAAIDVCYW